VSGYNSQFVRIWACDKVLISLSTVR